MNSPGNMPALLGDVWVGTTVCALQNCYFEWPQPTQPWWLNPHAPAAPYVAPQPQSHTRYHFAPAPLSDADVDRIARRVAEILREAKP